MTQASRTLLIVRAHKADTETLQAYDRYAALGTMDVLLSCDERAGIVEAGARHKTAYTLDTLRAMGLFAHPNCGWRCGDYAYYTARAARPDYDFYWMVEPDLLIHTADLKTMFAALNMGDADLLACRFGTRDARWDWHRTMRSRYENVYGCIFPITRLSGRALDHLYSARRRAHAPDTDVALTAWPNDEAFVGTELMNNGFVCRDLSEQQAGLYTRASCRTALPHDRATILAQPPDEMIHHPVRDLPAWLGRQSQAADAIGTRQRDTARAPPPGEIRLLLDMAAVAVEHEGLADAALFPLMLAGPGARNGSNTPSPRQARAGVRLKRYFGAPERRAIGAAHIISGLGPALKETPSQQDFTLEAAVPLRRVPLRFCLPFAADFSTGTLLATLHAYPRAVLKASALIDEQRRVAAVACMIPLQALEQLETTSSFPVTLQVLTETKETVRADAAMLISHPPLLIQLAARHADFRALSAFMQRALLHAAIAPYVVYHRTTAVIVTASVAQWLHDLTPEFLDLGFILDETFRTEPA